MDDLLIIALIGTGGGLGSIARYVATIVIQHYAGAAYPWGTFVVNASGSLLIGGVFGLGEGGALSSDAVTVLAAGVLGGYTTFSTFSLENLRMLQTGRSRWMLVNAVAQVLVSLSAVGAGYWLMQVIV